MATHVYDAATATFDREVLEASRSVPVVVDFWAPWCGPCRALKPILEKLAAEYDGLFRLAKINTDENPEIAAQYDVRGIPNVKAFVDGVVVNEFTGALPESAVRNFLAAVIPSPSEQLRQAARVDLAGGDFDGAEAKLRDALTSDVHNHAARVDLADVLVARRDFGAAAAELDKVPVPLRDERAAAIAARISFWERGQKLPDSAALKAQVDADPDDFGARFAYAERLVAEGRYQAALDELLEIVRRDRSGKREEARKAIVEVFRLAADDADFVSEYRRRLSAALY